jgi:hypothetical protein
MVIWGRLTDFRRIAGPAAHPNWVRGRCTRDRVGEVSLCCGDAPKRGVVLRVMLTCRAPRGHACPHFGCARYGRGGIDLSGRGHFHCCDARRLRGSAASIISGGWGCSGRCCRRTSGRPSTHRVHSQLPTRHTSPRFPPAERSSAHPKWVRWWRTGNGMGQGGLCCGGAPKRDAALKVMLTCRGRWEHTCTQFGCADD